MARTDRRLPPATDIVAFLLGLPPAARADAVAMMGLTEGDAFDRAWAEWAHAGQQVPTGDWRTWVIMAGRGFGKTLAGAHWVRDAAGQDGRLRIALVAATLDEARRVMIEGESGLLAVADGNVADWCPSLRRLRFTSGAEAALFSGASPEMLRGPQHHLAWCDELAKWEKPQESWHMLQLGLRLGDHPRALVTTTPRPGPLLSTIMANAHTVTTGGPTMANPHLSPSYIDNVTEMFAGTRLGRQELDGELLTDTPGALWSIELLERCRHTPSPQRGEGWGEGAPTPPGIFPTAEPPHSISLPAGERGPFTKIVIGVDPPTGDGTCGIIACAKDDAGIAHILADHSVTARSPEGWASAVANAARIHALSPLPRAEEGSAQQEDSAPTLFPGEGRGPAQNKDSAPAYAGAPPVLIVAEQNQGGKMVAAVLRTADPTLRVKPVTATVGKSERAAPVAMLFEAGRVMLHGRFPELEAELCGMIAGGDYEAPSSGGRGAPGRSPDRADAMVWALTELMLGKERGVPAIRAL